MRGRASSVKSAYTAEPPTPQSTADKSTTNAKCTRATAAGRADKTAVTNPTAIFSETAAVRPSSSQAEGRVGRCRTAAGVAPAGARTSTVPGGQTATVARPRSPWRYSTNLKPVRSSDAEVGRNDTRCRRAAAGGVSASPERRPRSASTSRVRRTKSVPATSTGNNDADDLPVPRSILKPSTPPLLAALHVEEKPPQPISTDPVVPEQTPKDKPPPPPTTSEALAQAAKSTWRKVSRPVVDGGFQPVLVALLVVALAVVAGCVYAYASKTATF